MLFDIHTKSILPRRLLSLEPRFTGNTWGQELVELERVVVHFFEVEPIKGTLTILPVK